jgi:hypothetical protein
MEKPVATTGSNGFSITKPPFFDGANYTYWE